MVHKLYMQDTGRPVCVNLHVIAHLIVCVWACVWGHVRVCVCFVNGE